MSRNTPHVLTIYRKGITKAEMRTGMGMRTWLYIGDQEVKLDTIRSVDLSTGIDGPDEITLRFYGTLEIVYADDLERDSA